MARMTFKQQRFDGGITSDIRTPQAGKAQLIKNFDIFTYPSTLKPYNSSESGNDTATREITTFLAAEGNLYGYGVDTGTSRARVYSKNGFTGGEWNDLANSAHSSGGREANTLLFVYYKSYIYGANANGSIWRCDPGSSFTDSWQSPGATNFANGIVHSKDDILYIPYDNKIGKFDNSTWTAAALTLPADSYITSICEYGNFLAIAAAPLGTAGRNHSRVYLWNRDDSLTTLSENIDWGAGQLLILEEFEGALVGIGYNGVRVQVKQYTGAGFQTLIEIISGSSTTPLTQRKQKVNDRLYFLANISIGGTQYNGVWTFGRNARGELVMSLDRTANNDTAPNSAYGFYLYHSSGTDYMFIAYNTGAAYAVSKTSDTPTDFSATSSFLTTVLDAQEKTKKKKLVGVSVTYQPLPAAGQVVLKYRKDKETSYTTIFTTTADDEISHSAVNIESTGASLPEFHEIQFLIESTGGAAITGFEFDVDIRNTRPY